MKTPHHHNPLLLYPRIPEHNQSNPPSIPHLSLIPPKPNPQPRKYLIRLPRHRRIPHPFLLDLRLARTPLLFRDRVHHARHVVAAAPPGGFILREVSALGLREEEGGRGYGRFGRLLFCTWWKGREKGEVVSRVLGMGMVGRGDG